MFKTSNYVIHLIIVLVILSCKSMMRRLFYGVK